MVRNRLFVISYLFLMFCMGIGVQSQSKDVYKIDDASSSLEKRTEMAKNLASKNDPAKGYWVGYCISRLMGKNSYTGIFDSRHRNAPSLYETVYGVTNEADPSPDFNSDCGAMKGNITINDGKHKEQKILKQVGMLVLFDANGKQVTDINVSNMSLHVDLETKSLYWIGSAHNDESVDLLQSLYKNSDDRDMQEELITAIGLHQASNEVFTFLSGVISGNDHDDLREDAVFWLGQQEDERVLPILMRTARMDNSEDVRENAVFSISEVSSEAAIDSLIALSRKGTDQETRSKAVFWLAEKASRKAIQAIKDVIDDDDEDTEVQRQALFALTQSEDNDEGIEDIIKIAKSHPNRKIRKEAIFWLGQSDDPKAIDALVEIVKK